MPSKPMVMNIPRQPNNSIMAVRMGGLMANPMVEAELKIPIGMPRSLMLNQSLMTFTPQGFIGASPIPRPIRTQINWVKLWIMPDIVWNADQINIPRPSMIRGPLRSSSGPQGNWAIP
ncbi:hypothetical protein D3C76_1590880 [compost metagenome]